MEKLKNCFRRGSKTDTKHSRKFCFYCGKRSQSHDFIKSGETVRLEQMKVLMEVAACTDLYLVTDFKIVRLQDHNLKLSKSIFILFCN
jgi:hypothetical protein